MRHIAFGLLLASVAALLPAALVGQQAVHGFVLEEGRGTPVMGALVVLLDTDGIVHRGTLSDASGAYRLPASAPGVYTIRVERLGYHAATHPPIILSAGTEMEVTLHAEIAVIAIAEIGARGVSRCTVRPTEGMDVHTLWENARTVLFSAAVLQDQELVEYEVRTYTIETLPRMAGVYTLDEDVLTVRGRPFATLSGEELAAHGFVRIDGDEILFHGPDAQALLSDAFLDVHCLAVDAGGVRDDGLIGLSFEPVSDLTVSGIRGVLWLDAASGELRRIEYRYANIPEAGANQEAGGEIEFTRIPEGGWVVSRWWIRSGFGRWPTALVGADVEPMSTYREAGGEVLHVRWRGGDGGVEAADS